MDSSVVTDGAGGRGRGKEEVNGEGKRDATAMFMWRSELQFPISLLGMN